ncbi:asparagine synthase [Pseudomaricurvus alkylphenolicus]|nr:asparagine synthase C-terminal domain-containing protein [Pseudomaricurvus alkylphenolicus]NIB43114.1 asparagine synthase [Pseudomaricurvus alkylphenolicus]
MKLAVSSSALETRIDPQFSLATNGSTHSCKDTLIVAAIVGSPFWSDPALQDLHDQYDAAHSLVQAYQAYGDECLCKLRGSYALALVDPVNKRALVATDRFCQHSLYYQVIDRQLIFGTSARVVVAHPDVNVALNAQSIYDYIFFHMIPSPVSIYKGLHKLQAASVLTLEQDSVSSRSHWSPTFTETNNQPFESKQDSLQSALRQSVKRQLQQYEGKKIGSFLSGGLDSSTVTGHLAELTERSAPAFSIGFSAEGYDEMAYARTVSRHFGVELHEYYVTPQDVTDALPSIATSYDEPFGNSSALPAWFCAQMASREGMDLLLAGDGGDELFGGNERYAKQLVFERFYHLPPIGRSALEWTINRLPTSPKLLQKAKSYIQQAKIPLPDRLQTYNYLQRHNPSEVFTSDFLANIETEHPFALLRDNYFQLTDIHQLNAMMRLDWQFTLADNDIRKVSHMCSQSGIEVAYPMLDDDLVDFSCKIPSREKLLKGNLRDFYKRSLRGWLPDATIDKTKQGFGLPFGVWLKEHTTLRNLSDDLLESLKTRGIIRIKFIDEIKRLHRSTHAHYYGELIWVLIILEAWLNSQENLKT